MVTSTMASFLIIRTIQLVPTHWQFANFLAAIKLHNLQLLIDPRILFKFHIYSAKEYLWFYSTIFFLWLHITKINGFFFVFNFDFYLFLYYYRLDFKFMFEHSQSFNYYHATNVCYTQNKIK